MLESQPKELTDLQRRFVEEYPLDCNATQACIRAGYSRDTARQMGSENLSKPYIRAALDERLRLAALPADEALKLTADIATTRLNDYMVVREVQGYQLEEQYVTVLIAHAQNEIKTVEAFIGRRKLTKEARVPFDAKITELYGKILEWEILVERYDDEVTLLVPGRPVCSAWLTLI